MAEHDAPAKGADRSSEPLLRVEGLTKRYDDVTAVRGISFAVHAGEIVGLLGANGAGKSTTLHMLLALLQPTAGRIEVFGRDPFRQRAEVLSRMNLAAPYAGLPYNLTPLQNLITFGLMYGLSRPKQRAEALLSEFGLAGFRHQRTGGLSSGEQMRLILAKAFMNAPRFLLLDEPTASLDPVAARDLRGRIAERVRAVGGAALWTSHNMQEMERMADRILVLQQGKLVADGSPATLKRRFAAADLEEVFFSLSR